MTPLAARAPRRLWMAVGTLFLLSFPYHPGLRSPNELCRLWQTRAIVDHHRLRINETLREYGPVGDLSYKDGNYYPSKAPLLSVAAVPTYWVLKAVTAGPVSDSKQVYFSRLFLIVLPTLVMLVFLQRFLRAYVSDAVASGVTATYAVGTIALNYSLAFMSHQLTAVLLFAACYSVWRTVRGEWSSWGWAAAGVWASAAVAAEYTAALGVMCIALYAVWALVARGQIRKLPIAAVLVSAGAVPLIAGLMWYHWVCFGHPLESGYKYLNDAAYQPWHLGGFLGIRYPDPRAFLLSFFSPLRGLYVLSPVLLFSLAGWRSLRHVDRSLAGYTAVLFAANAYFTSSFAYDSWGWAVGPRHLTPLLPFLMLPIAVISQKWREGDDVRDGYLASLLAAAATISVVACGAASWVNYVPDNVSTSLGALVVPLLREGFAPITLLGVFGVPNPAAGGVAVAAVAWVAVEVWLTLRPRSTGQSRRHWLVLGGSFAVYAAVLAAATRGDAADVAAADFLKSVWLAPPGSVVRW